MEKLDFSNIDWWNGEQRPSTEFINRVNVELTRIQESLEKIPESEPEGTSLERKSKLLEGLIKHYLDLTKVLDQRRGDYYKAALQMSAIGLTGFGLLIKLIDFSPITVVSLLSLSVCLGLLSILATAFLVIDKYYWQTNSKRYHFLKLNSPKVKVLGNSWMYFYHGIPGVGEIPFTSNPFKEVDKLKDQENGVEKYVAGAAFYFDQFINATSRELYIQNLRHTYMLLIHNAYKNKFDAQLTSIMSRGTRITFVITFICILLSFIFWPIANLDFAVDESKTKIELNYNPSKTDSLRSPRQTPESQWLNSSAQMKIPPADSVIQANRTKDSLTKISLEKKNYLNHDKGKINQPAINQDSK
ncbi:hypothetical protein [Pedobacter frigoris]|uniref:hypothetical protein n=1 Tax=Pedobacter frigoris TaxID=2571272 RepID=UPI002931DAC4|nr:hypothetical protein [Pedobacter frigoris]